MFKIVIEHWVRGIQRPRYAIFEDRMNALFDKGYRLMQIEHRVGWVYVVIEGVLKKVDKEAEDESPI